MEPLFYVDRAKGGRASCKGCKDKCLNGELRMAKVVPSPYSDEQKMKSWYHVDCLMNALLKQRPATKRIETVHDIGNWENISKDDQEFILDKINETEKLYFDKHSGKIKLNVLTNDQTKPKPKDAPNEAEDDDEEETKSAHQDGMFSEFVRLCNDISKEDSYLGKTAIVNNFFTKGTDKKGFKGNVTMWCSLLLPQAVKRVYNLKSKQLAKLFSRILHADHDDMLTDLENGDVAKTIETFFSKSRNCKPASESTLTLDEVNTFLEKLSTMSKEDEQVFHFKTIVKRCTDSDLRMIIRLIKGDLRINAGPKHILEGVHPDAYTAFQTSRDINLVLSRVLSGSSTVKDKQSPQKTVQAKIALMTPVLPMLAEACKSVEMAMRKCPNGMFSEIKYDGERVQVHKQGKEFKYFSRALKPVMPHKVNHFKDYIPQAFPRGEDLILDAEVLMVDTDTGKPLPFGTLGVHKQEKFKNAQVCLFVFDCIYYNGDVLLDVPIRKRREILQKNMVEVKNHVMFSEQELIRKPSDLADMISKVIKLGLEGLILKDLESVYQPGKRHWLKVKKDYLFDGAMADTADLVVLGAWFGTGRKGGMMSVFLMGCYDEDNGRWVTVTKVHGGHDDKTLEKLQDTLGVKMVKISQDSSKVPDWLHCTNTMIPDFVAKDPKKQPVWEITGTEFTKAKVHTADGISVRFPRVTRIRDDKDWKTATNLTELKAIFKNSKENTDVSLLTKLAATARGDEDQFSGVKASPGKKTGDKKIDSYFSKNAKRTSDESDTEEKIVPKKKIKIESPEQKTVSKDMQLLPKKPLPDTFKGHKLGFYPDFISFSEFDRNLVERHWTAYGGTVVKSLQDHNVEYVLHKKSKVMSADLKIINKRWPSKVRHVSKQWLMKCIATKKMCDPRPYCVSLMPTVT